jgi:hypothetical protein
MATTRSSPSPDRLRADLVQEIQELVADAPSPFAVVFPELNLSFPERQLTPRDILTLVIGMQARGLVRCSAMDGNGKSVPISERMIEDIAEDYRNGARDSRTVRQLDGIDIWIERAAAA